jgi:hypothetical protein
LVGKPLKISGAARADGHADDFRDVVRVELANGSFDGGVTVAICFDEAEPLVGSLDFILPAVNAVHGAEDLYAAGETALDEFTGDAVGFFSTGCSDGDLEKVGHRSVSTERASAFGYRFACEYT